MTLTAHSAEDLENAVKASEILFGKSTAANLKALNEKTFLDVFEGVPQAEISRGEVEAGLDIVSALSEKTGFLKSNGEAKRALKQNSISVNQEKVADGHNITTEDLINNRFILLQSGKKNYFVIRVMD